MQVESWPCAASRGGRDGALPNDVLPVVDLLDQAMTHSGKSLLAIAKACGLGVVRRPVIVRHTIQCDNAVVL